MLIEDMRMVFLTIRSNKIRSTLTMLGITISIGSVIAIVSIGNAVRGLFSDLYKDMGIARTYVSIGYWVDDMRQSDYFNLNRTERAKEVFKDQVAYIDSSASTSNDAEHKRTKTKFGYQGIDYNYQGIQPMSAVYGRYFNERDILGRRKNMVVGTRSVQMPFGTENVVGRSSRATLYDSTDDFTVVRVYRKETSVFQALMMGSSNDKGPAFIPYTLLTRPNDNLCQLHVYAKEDVSLNQLFSQFKVYAAKVRDRQPEDMYMYTVMQEMISVDNMMGNLSTAASGIAAILLLIGGIGIMNITLVPVTGRTGEIGIKKALGTRTRDALIQLLTESATLSACGGIIGVTLEVGTVSLRGFLLGFAVVIKPAAIIVAVPLSAVVGIFFGLYPASKVARADPIDTPRCEQPIKEHW